MYLAWLFQEPPRITRIEPVVGPVGSTAGSALYWPYQSAHHSCTLPSMSYRPRGLGALPRTGRVPARVCGYCFSGQSLESMPLLSSNLSPQLPAYQAMVSRTGALFTPWGLRSPTHVAAVVPPRHAYSHSASLGSRAERP